MTYRIGSIQAVKEEGYHPLAGSDTNMHRYRNERGQRLTRTYGATTIHYSFKKAS